MAARKSFEPEPVRTGVGIGAEHLQPCVSGDFDEGLSDLTRCVRGGTVGIRSAGICHAHARNARPAGRDPSGRGAGYRRRRRGRGRRDRALDRLAAGAARTVGRGVRPRRRRRRGEPRRHRHARRGGGARAGRSGALGIGAGKPAHVARVRPRIGGPIRGRHRFPRKRHAGGGARPRRGRAAAVSS